MRSSENRKYDALLTRTAVYFSTNYCLCLLPLLFCVYYAAWIDVALCISFVLQCFSSLAHRRISKKMSKQRRTPAGWCAWPWNVYIFFILLYTAWYLILPEAAWTKHILIIVLSLLCGWVPLYWRTFLLMSVTDVCATPTALRMCGCAALQWLIDTWGIVVLVAVGWYCCS